MDSTRSHDMTTLIEDDSNVCWASGPAGMSDGVMTTRKKTSEIWLNFEHYWLMGISRNTAR